MNSRQIHDKTIVVIEDDRAISNAYTFKFKLAGYSVVQCFDGVEGIAYFKKGGKADIILLDLLMPKMSGEVFLEKLRKLEDHRHVPVVVLTNLGREEAPKTIWQHGVHSFVIKVSTTPKQLLEFIESSLL